MEYESLYHAQSVRKGKIIWFVFIVIRFSFSFLYFGWVKYLQVIHSRFWALDTSTCLQGFLFLLHCRIVSSLHWYHVTTTFDILDIMLQLLLIFWISCCNCFWYFGYHVTTIFDILDIMLQLFLPLPTELTLYTIPLIFLNHILYGVLVGSSISRSVTNLTGDYDSYKRPIYSCIIVENKNETAKKKTVFRNIPPNDNIIKRNQTPKNVVESTYKWRILNSNTKNRT